MANDISLSSSVRSNLLSLQNTADLLASTQQRLATGNKVNSALDNPTSFFTAASLKNRASDLGTLLDNAGQSVQTIKAADAGVEAISTLLDSAKAILVQAQTKKVSSSSNTFTLTSTTDDRTAFGIGTADTLTVSTNNNDGTTTDQTISITATNTRSEITNLLNALDGVTATFDATANTVSITSTHGRALSISASGGTPTQGVFSAAVDVAAVTNERDALVANFNQLLTQINQISADASYKGVNLLSGNDLTVYFNEDQTSSLVIEGVNLTTSGALAIGSSSTSQVVQDSHITSQLAAVDSAKTTIRTQASKFGSNLSVVETRTDFTESLINTLKEGASQLTLADSNQEGANLLALQTRQQLSTVSLSLASQADQAVLRLF